MNYSVYLRPLEITDAKTSYKWRNNPVLWKYTEFKPNKNISIAIETAWLKKVLKCKNAFRFAICLLDSGKYLGNIQLVNIDDKIGYFHVFIGETSFWGKGIAKEATQLMLNYGFSKLGLTAIKLKVHQNNSVAKAIYQKMGFQEINKEGDFLVMSLQRNFFFGNSYIEKNKNINLTEMAF
jgi:RimJ/RimL family protein N-acetyltransferase